MVPQDARVVDEDVEGTEGPYRLIDQMPGAGPVGDVVAVDDGLAS